MTFKESLNIPFDFSKNKIDANNKICISTLHPVKTGTTEILQAHASLLPLLFLAQSASEAGLPEGVCVLFLEGWHTPPTTASAV